MPPEKETEDKTRIERLKEVLKNGNRQIASEALILLEEEGEVDLKELKKELKKDVEGA